MFASMIKVLGVHLNIFNKPNKQITFSGLIIMAGLGLKRDLTHC